MMTTSQHVRASRRPDLHCAPALLFLCALLPVQLTLAQTPLTTVRAVRALQSQDVTGKAVVLRGVVTALSGWKNSFFLEDATAGISVDRTTTIPETLQGDLVEVRGHTEQGMFAPIVRADSVIVRGHAPLRKARLFAAGELRGGSEDSQWVAVRGTVRSVDVAPLWGHPRLVLTMDLGGTDLVPVVVHDYSPEAAQRLRAAVVQVRAVCGTMFNARRQFVGVRLFTGSLNDVDVVKPGPAEPFAVPERSLAGLLRFRDGSERDQVKVTGTVTWSRTGEGFYLQEKGEGIFVQVDEKEAAPIGSRVEAVGYPSVGAYSPQLQNALFRQIGASTPPVPVNRSAGAIIQDRDGFPAVADDSLLVHMRGTLLEQYTRGDEDIYLLRDGNTVFTVRAMAATLGNLRLDDGAEIAVTGVLTVNTNGAHQPRGFSLRLRSRDDIAVLKAAPWWTPQHAAWAMGVLAAVSLVLLAVIGLLRRDAKLQAFAVGDPLTGLYNRRGFMAFAQQRWRAAQKQGVPLILFYVDLDHFKQINDTFGHKQGDQALLSMANVLRESCRKQDVVGRLGGDEFAIVALDSTHSLQESLRQRVEGSMARLNGAERLPFPIEFSIGVTIYDPEMASGSIEELLDRADTAMYEHKRQRGTDRRTHPVSLVESMAG